jgi:hypothetical protein
MALMSRLDAPMRAQRSLTDHGDQLLTWIDIGGGGVLADFENSRPDWRPNDAANKPDEVTRALRPAVSSAATASGSTASTPPW